MLEAVSAPASHHRESNLRLSCLKRSASNECATAFELSYGFVGGLQVTRLQPFFLVMQCTDFPLLAEYDAFARYTRGPKMCLYFRL